MMKTSSLLALLLFCSVVYADVASVGSKVTRINALKLAVKTQDRTDLSSEGAQISVWRDAKGTPRKIVARIYGEMGRAHDTLYLEKGVPVFTLEVDENYNSPLSGKVVARKEIRSYFEDGKILLRKENNKVVALNVAQKQAANKAARQMVQLYLSRGQ